MNRYNARMHAQSNFNNNVGSNRRIPTANANLNSRLDDESFYTNDEALEFPYQNVVDNAGRILNNAQHFVRYSNHLCDPNGENPAGFAVFGIANDTHPERVRHIVNNLNFTGNNFLSCRTVNRIISSDNIFNVLSAGYHPLNSRRQIDFNYVNNAVEETYDIQTHQLMQYLLHQKQLSKDAYKAGRYKPRANRNDPLERYTKQDHEEFVGMIAEAVIALGFHPHNHPGLEQLKTDMRLLCPTYTDFIEDPNHPLEDRWPTFEVTRDEYYSFDAYCPTTETTVEDKDCRDFHRKMHQGPGKFYIKSFTRRYRGDLERINNLRKSVFMSTNLSLATRAIFAIVPCIITHFAAARGTSIESLISNVENEYLTLTELLSAMKEEFDSNISADRDISLDNEYINLVKLLREYRSLNGRSMPFPDTEVSNNIVDNNNQIIGVYGVPIDRINENLRKVLSISVRLKHYSTLDFKRMYKDGVRCIICIDATRDKPIIQLRHRVHIIRTSLTAMDTQLMKFINNTKWLSLFNIINNIVHHNFNDLMRGNANDRVDYQDVIDVINDHVIPELLEVVNRPGGRNVDEVIRELNGQQRVTVARNNNGGRRDRPSMGYSVRRH